MSAGPASSLRERLSHLLAGLSPVLLAASCVAPLAPSAEVWIGDPPRTTTDAAASPASPAAPAQRISIAGAMNETLDLRFAVRPAAAIVRPTLHLSEFRQAGKGSLAFDCKFFRMHPVRVARFPGWHVRSIPPDHRDAAPLDALLPMDAAEAAPSLAANMTHWFWADLKVPKGIDEGLYSARIEIKDGATVMGAVDVELTVWPFVLPDAAEITAIAELDHKALVRELALFWRDAALHHEYWQDHPKAAEVNGRIHDVVRMLDEHRIAAVLPELSPRVSMHVSGDAAIDWSAHDALIGPMAGGQIFEDRLGIAAIPLPYRSAMAAFSGRRGSDLMLRRYFTQATIHFKERGWLDRAYALLPAGPPQPEAYESAKDLAELISTATADELKVASKLVPQDMRPYGLAIPSYTDLTDAVDIWLPPAQFYEPAVMHKEQDRRREAWLSADRPPFSGTTELGAPDAHAIVLGWQAAMLDAAALYLGPINNWPAEPAGSSPDRCAGHDARSLLYPGRFFGLPGPIPSVRLKHVRRTMQDAAYLKLLADHQLEHVGRAVTGALAWAAGTKAYRTHFADGKRLVPWAENSDRFDLARRFMAEELTRVVYGRGSQGRDDTFARSASWLRLMNDASRVAVSADGVRVRLAGSPANPVAEIQAVATVENTSRTPLTGELSLGGVPPSIAAEKGPLAEVRPGQSLSFSLNATGKLPELLAARQLDLRLELQVRAGPAVVADARLALAAAAHAAPAFVDGDLSEWALQDPGALSGFRRISPACEHDAGRRPLAKTMSWVRRDDRGLYIAVACESRSPAPAGSSRKAVRYDDLIPAGEDLIEVLIDPLNLGSRSPADLYHLVVKRSGADLAEKGIAFDPPVFERSPWAADIDVAVRDEGQRWVAEIRIPLDAFSPGPHRHELWGFNITRFDVANQEFSTWSGAEGNAYDPLSLGNLYLP